MQIPKSVLVDVRLCHLASEIDLSIMLPEGLATPPSDVLTGFTEWVGDWNGTQVSVGWDWGVVAGQIIVLNGTEIRSNIQVIMDNKLPASSMLTRIYLLEWIETIPWRDTAIPNLIRGAH